MFRVAVISIVLTFAAGPNAKLACQAWCDSHETAGNACHHEGLTPLSRVSAAASCDSAPVGVNAVLRDQGGRASTDLDARAAVVASSYQVAPLTADRRINCHSGRARALERRPLATALRI